MCLFPNYLINKLLLNIKSKFNGLRYVTLLGAFWIIKASRFPTKTQLVQTEHQKQNVKNKWINSWSYSLPNHCDLQYFLLQPRFFFILSQPFKLLGILDVENVPCARDSVLYGSLGSVVAGLGHFLLTSRIRRSCDVGVGGFIFVTLGYWIHCRYNYAKLRIQERITREGIKNKILYESTHLDPERKQTSSSSST